MQSTMASHLTVMPNKQWIGLFSQKWHEQSPSESAHIDNYLKASNAGFYSLQNAVLIPPVSLAVQRLESQMVTVTIWGK